jgi:hypothetical protein
MPGRQPIDVQAASKATLDFRMPNYRPRQPESCLPNRHGPLPRRRLCAEAHRHRPPSVERSGNKSWTHWRFIGPTFLRQSFIEWIGETVPHSFWAKAFYQSRRAKEIPHQVILRALAFKWIRIFWRCWYDRQPYDKARYLLALQKRHSPIIAHAAQSN